MGTCPANRKGVLVATLNQLGIMDVTNINVEIVEDGKNGFWCSSDQDWISRIELLMQNDLLRRTMGEEARKKVVGQYSVDSNSSNFLSLFQ